jgi:5-methyltetrahydropteroyltriglutamate--homocysteine methyltransferase
MEGSGFSGDGVRKLSQGANIDSSPGSKKLDKQAGKIRQDRLMTAIVGSYPKPRNIFNGSGRQLLDEVGLSFYELEREIGATDFQERLDRAALMAIEDQNEAGIDFITDGEERRGHYVLYVLRKLAGIDFDHLTEKPIREGRYVRRLPTVVDKIAYRQPVLVDDFVFTDQHTAGIAKIGLPGPSTVVDSVADAYYDGDRERMAGDYAQAIRHEVENLIQAGCQAIQFDDPVLLRYPEQAQQWGLDLLQACFEGLESQATFFVHICRGYPDKPLERQGISYKANADYYTDILSWLSDSTIDVVSIEGAQSNLDLSVLPAIGKKTVMLGTLDVGSNKVESVTALVDRGREALRHLPREQLLLAPDCGMLQLSRTAAKEKLTNLASAARELNS